MTTFPELREALTVRLHKIVADPMLCDDYCNAMIEAAETIDAQAAEIERLREALEQIASQPHAPDAYIVASAALEQTK